MGPRFNGVEDEWTDDLQFVVIDGASMGPRFNGVEDPFLAGVPSWLDRLQWGHALMAWKTVMETCRSRRHVRASMGPRFNGVEDPRSPPTCSAWIKRFNGATL